MNDETINSAASESVVSTLATPGPWTNDHYDDDDMLVISAKSRIGYIPIAEMRCGYDGHIEIEQHANARLIAAAPDMLALLQELIDIEGPQPGTSEWARKVHAAIAKATTP